KKLGDVLSKLNDLQKEFEMTKTSKERKEEIGKELENLAPFYQRYELLLGLKTDELSNPIREELKKKSLEQLTQGL
ncbi:MAG: hypothetical protein U9Q99_00140, partial [Nanoarchaeota archaeon]|nr:hypothetical protein [Nanoarchaeota archaeon]